MSEVTESRNEHHLEEGESNPKTQLLAKLPLAPRSPKAHFSVLTISRQFSSRGLEEGPLPERSKPVLRQASFSTPVLQEPSTVLVVILERH